jgi:hypothetical protein
MRVLTLRAPWAALIAAGFKLVENRTWEIKWRGTVLIHQGQRRDRVALDLPHVAAAYATVPVRLLAPGHVLALAEITGCHRAGKECTAACSPWGEPGAFHWQLQAVRALRAPVPACGSLGLWKPSPALLTTLATRNPDLDLAA